MTKNSILTVGSVAFDSIQTPAGKAEQVLGGSANYFSIAASFYSPVKIVAVVGDDFPKNHLEFLSGRGIDVSGIELAEGKTFHWVGQYDQNLNEAKTLSTFLNVFEKFAPKLKPSHVECETLFLGNIDPTLQLSVLDQAKSAKFVACDTMNFWITGKRNEVLEVLKRIDLLSINEGEAYLLSGQKNIVSAAETILGMGPSTLIIKRGEYGATLFTNAGDIFIAPAFPVSKVIDPTGAGDSFAGAMIGYLSAHSASRETAKKDPKAWNTLMRKAVLSGCVMASFTVEDFGFHRLMRLKKEELELRNKSLKEMITVQ